MLLSPLSAAHILCWQLGYFYSFMMERSFSADVHTAINYTVFATVLQVSGAKLFFISRKKGSSLRSDSKNTRYFLICVP